MSNSAYYQNIPSIWCHRFWEKSHEDENVMRKILGLLPPEIPDQAAQFVHCTENSNPGNETEIHFTLWSLKDWITWSKGHLFFFCSHILFITHTRILHRLMVALIPPLQEKVQTTQICKTCVQSCLLFFSPRLLVSFFHS